MTFYQLGFRYLLRKKIKTLLLFWVLFVINSMILSTSMILRATADSRSTIQEKTNSKIVLDPLDEKTKLTQFDIDQIKSIDGVASVNSLSRSPVFPVNFGPATQSDSEKEENRTVSLLSYDDLEKDSAFSDHKYRLDAGKYMDKDTAHGIVINTVLADTNQLKLGDVLEFEAGDKTVRAEIIGLFSAGNERRQMESADAVNRIENQIFTDNTTYSRLFEEASFYRTVVYVKHPEEARDLDSGRVSMPFEESKQEVKGVRIEITPRMIGYDGLGVGILITLSVLGAGISIVKRNPKDILSQMS